MPESDQADVDLLGPGVVGQFGREVAKQVSALFGRSAQRDGVEVFEVYQPLVASWAEADGGQCRVGGGAVESASGVSWELGVGETPSGSGVVGCPGGGASRFGTASRSSTVSPLIWAAVMSGSSPSVVALSASSELSASTRARRALVSHSASIPLTPARLASCRSVARSLGGGEAMARPGAGDVAVGVAVLGGPPRRVRRAGRRSRPTRRRGDRRCRNVVTRSTLAFATGSGPATGRLIPDRCRWLVLGCLRGQGSMTSGPLRRARRAGRAGGTRGAGVGPDPVGGDGCCGGGMGVVGAGLEGCGSFGECWRGRVRR